MGSSIFLITALSLLLSIITTSATSDVFQVTGKVLCQDCTKGWNEWAKGGNPIKGSKVSVTCMDERKRVVHYASDLTDDAGNFEVSCNKYAANGKQLKRENCFLRLVSSGDQVCNVATDFEGGKSGVRLVRPNVVYRDITKYMLGPFYYTTPMCDEPDVNSPKKDDDEGKEEENESFPDGDEKQGTY